jgi:hypothetical protein
MECRQRRGTGSRREKLRTRFQANVQSATSDIRLLPVLEIQPLPPYDSLLRPCGTTLRLPKSCVGLAANWKYRGSKCLPRGLRNLNSRTEYIRWCHSATVPRDRWKQRCRCSVRVQLQEWLLVAYRGSKACLSATCMLDRSGKSMRLNVGNVVIPHLRTSVSACLRLSNSNMRRQR